MLLRLPPPFAPIGETDRFLSFNILATAMQLLLLLGPFC